MNYRNWVAGLAAAGLLAGGSAQAALLDRGGGMLYDTVLNITWLQDANYAKTSGYDADGAMTWTQAGNWAANLVYGGFSDWRLASNTPVNGTSWNYATTNNGSTDAGYNITSPHSELAYMYYVNLGLTGYYLPNGSYNPGFGVFGNGSTGGQADVGLVDNLRSGYYWSGTPYATDPGSSAWYFGAIYGNQNYGGQASQYFAWAVRDGDVTNGAPEPAGLGLALMGLSLLGLVRRCRSCLAS